MQASLQQKWEYQIERAPSIEAMHRVLVESGKEGWELITILGGSEASDGGPVKTLRSRRAADFQAIFKRPLLEA